jgi:hypothetical protein
MNRFCNVANRERRYFEEAFGEHLHRHRVVASIVAGRNELAPIDEGKAIVTRGLSR